MFIFDVFSKSESKLEFYIPRKRGTQVSYVGITIDKRFVTIFRYKSNYHVDEYW